MEKRIIIGRNDLSATILVPWDCGMNCKFCTIKKDYDGIDKTKVNVYCFDIKRKINMSGMNEDIKSYVFSGGEPVADIERLIDLVKVAKNTGKPVYVNANANAIFVQKYADLWVELCSMIDGMNVSLHFNYDTSEKCLEELGVFLKYVRSVRINCVIDHEHSYSTDYVEHYINSVSNGLKHSRMSINFRRDYTKTTQQQLHSVDDEFLKCLFELDGVIYDGHSGCLVCANDAFDFNGTRVVYHRGLSHTVIYPSENTSIVHDIIIDQKGIVRLDWPCDDNLHMALTDDDAKVLFSRKRLINPYRRKTNKTEMSVVEKLRAIGCPISTQIRRKTIQNSESISSSCGSGSC